MHLPTFIAVNVAIDVEVVMAVAMENYYATEHLHGVSHTLVGASILGLFVWGFVRTKASLYAALFAAISHVLLDSIVHPDVLMFSFMPPDESWRFNPIYGIVPHWAIEIPLLLLLSPIVWDCFKWVRAKLPRKFLA